jgi:outer membrane protein assembly factor BamB
VWKSDDLRNRRLGAPLALPRAVVVGDMEGQIHFLSPRDGSLLARVPSDGGPIAVAPQRWATAVVVQTTKGTLMLLQPGS